MLPLEIDPTNLGDSVLALLISFTLALPLAWNREHRTRLVGLRTFPLVAIASCSYMLIGLQVAGGDPNALSRVINGLMTGVGFVGGGAILKSGADVQGTSTAAAIWATGAIGAAVAHGRVGLAAAIAVITFLTFLILTPLGDRIRREERRGGSGLRTGAPDDGPP